MAAVTDIQDAGSPTLMDTVIGFVVRLRPAVSVAVAANRHLPLVKPGMVAFQEVRLMNLARTFTFTRLASFVPTRTAVTVTRLTAASSAAMPTTWRHAPAVRRRAAHALLEIVVEHSGRARLMVGLLLASFVDPVVPAPAPPLPGALPEPDPPVPPLPVPDSGVSVGGFAENE